jgi:hypothetical protein
MVMNNGVVSVGERATSVVTELVHALQERSDYYVGYN